MAEATFLAPRVRELLLGTADYIDKHGLYQKGGYGIAGGPCCALGSLRMLMVGDPREVPKDRDEYQVYVLAQDVMCDLGRQAGAWGVFGWSDGAANPAEITGALRAAAESVTELRRLWAGY